MSWPRAPLLTVASSSRTGPAEGLISLARELRSMGLDARFAGDTVRPGEHLGDHLAHAGVPFETDLRLSRKVRVRDVLHDVSLLAARLGEGRHDLVHAAFAHDHLVALLAARRVHSPDVRVIRAAQRSADVTPGFLSRRLWALQRTDGVVVHCEAYRQRLIAAGLSHERVATIHGSVDPLWFSPGPSPLRSTWGIPEGAPLAGIVARMKPERGHRQLLQGFALALREVPDARLVLVGRGEDEAALRAYANELAISGRVAFGGYLRGPGLVDAYRALDVAVWLREGNDGACRGVLEAMACEKPVVAGNQGAPAELVREGIDGSVVDPADPAAIGRALSALLGDRERRRELGLSARARALEFDSRRAAEATLAFWRRLRDLPPMC